MHTLFRGYMKENYEITYHSSLFAIKPILFASEIDDSRPTIIKQHTMKPQLISIFSGKVSSIFDLEELFNK